MLKRQHRQHRRVSRRPDGHRVLSGQGGWELDQPFAFNARLLRVATVVGLAQAPAVGDYALANSDAGVRGNLDRAGEVDAGN